MSERLVFDIETDGLLYDVTKIHCIVIRNLDTGDAKLYRDIPEALDRLSKASLLAGHNICGYDILAIRKLYPTWTHDAVVIDTMIAGCILYPDDRILSLEEWAKKLRLKTQKVQNEDWSVYTENMGSRCLSDVDINASVYQYLIQNPEFNNIERALVMEQQIAMLHAMQSVTGVTFDVNSAEDLMQLLDARIAESREEVIQIAPWKCVLPGVAKMRQESEKADRLAIIQNGKIPKKPTILPFKKDGNYSVATKNYFGPYYQKVRGPYTKISCEPINPDSPDEVKELLLGLGWRPTEWNFKKDADGKFVTDREGKRIVTSPKLTEDSYDSLPPGLGKLIGEYRTMNHRRNFLQNKTDEGKGALASVRKDGRVSADAFTCGTNTGRYRHSGTVCNIPRPSSPYGKEIRSLFTAAEGKVLVGVDLSGIEARCLAWYLIRGGYTDAEKTAALILSPDKGNDFHSYNAKQWGVSRDIAKNGLYALMYGAGAIKLAQTLGKPESEGAKLKKDFYKAHPGIQELVEDLEKAYKSRGHLYGIDGRPLYIRQINKLLNTLLQNTAAVVFKRWMVKLAGKKESNPLFSSVLQLIAYHDELQFECDEKVARDWAAICTEAALEVGKEMEAPIPIEAEAKIGMNWGLTH